MKCIMLAPDGVLSPNLWISSDTPCIFIINLTSCLHQLDEFLLLRAKVAYHLLKSFYKGTF